MIDRKREIIVPKNKKACEDLDFGNETIDIITLSLSRHDFKILFFSGILEKISLKTNKLIDDYEQEKIEKPKLELLLSIINNKRHWYQFSLNKILNKISLMVEYAIKYNTAIYFYF